MGYKQRLVRALNGVSGLLKPVKTLITKIKISLSTHVIFYHQLSADDAHEIVNTYRRCYAMELNKAYLATARQSVLCLDLASLLSHAINLDDLSSLSTVKTVVFAQVDRVYRLPEIIEAIRRYNQQPILTFNSGDSG